MRWSLPTTWGRLQPSPRRTEIRRVRCLVTDVFLDGVDEGIDEPSDLGLGLSPDLFFGLPGRRKPLGKSLAFLGPVHDSGDPLGPKPLVPVGVA